VIQELKAWQKEGALPVGKQMGIDHGGLGVVEELDQWEKVG